MLHVERTEENRLVIRLDGHLDADAMRQAVTDLVTKSEGIEHGQLWYEVGDFDLPTLGALAVELSHIVELFRVMARFDRAAVIADAHWVRRVSEWEGKLIPGLDIRAFEPAHRDDAEAWLNG